jgi:hypothetical protein
VHLVTTWALVSPPALRAPKILAFFAHDDKIAVMVTHITLTRKAAAIKLESIRSATYYFKRSSGARYERLAKIEDVVELFRRDPRARLRIRLSDSAHVVTIVRNRSYETGYEVGF